ncbi:MAG: hypothetical protein V3S18_04835, partial [Dehalococcoidia bacterium]
MRLKLFRRFAAFTAAVVLLVTASAGSGSAALAGGDPGARGIARAIAAQEAHTDALMDIDGVVGTGVGAGSNGNAIVYVFTETAGVKGIPSRLDGVVVVPAVTGKISALHHRPGHSGGPGGGGEDPTPGP